MTAYELARLLLEGPDLTVQVVSERYVDVFGAWTELKSIETHEDEGEIRLIAD